MGPEDHIQVDLADPDDTRSAIDEIKPRGPNPRMQQLRPPGNVFRD
jgi:hypothetical protein